MVRLMSKKTKIIILSAFSILFIICLCLSRKQSQTVFIRLVQDASKEIAVIAEIQSEDLFITINAFQTNSGDYYLFLPSCAEGKNLVIDRNTFSNAQMDKSDAFFSSEIVESGMTISVDAEHDLMILTGSEIPSVFLTLKNDLSYISSDKTLSDSGQAIILNADGKSVYVGGLKKIKGRGNTSWEQEKKPFNITLEGTASLPGISGLTSEFALVTSTDTSFLRNRISNEMSKVMEAPHVEGICVNLYINNSFEGVYEIYQKIKPDSLDIWDLEAETEQVNRYQDSISQYTTGITLDDWNQSITGKWWDYENNPDNITGGYILEMDSASRYEDETSGFILDSGAYVVSKSPSCLSEAQYQYIYAYTQECENKMVASVGRDNYDELSEYIDVPSFVAKYLVEEVSKNIDCSATSQYFYKDQDGVLYAGPAWDYDWAYGVARIQEDIDYLDPEGFSARDIPGTLTWWQLLYYNGAIYNDITSVYEKTLYPYLNRITDSELFLWEEEMAESAVMDYLRWKRCESSDLYEIRNKYHNQVEMVSDFLSERKEFLYKKWIAE